MILALHPKTDELLDELTNKGDKLFWSDVRTQEVTGLHTFDFIMPANSRSAAFFGERSRFLTPARSGGWHEFVVYETKTHYSSNEKEVFGVAAYSELDKQQIIAPRRYDGWTLRQFAEHALRDTEFQIGTVEFNGSATTEVSDYMGAYSFLKRIQESFVEPFEIRFRTEVDGNRIVGRYVDLVEKVGADIPKEVEAGKDLIDMTRTVNDDDIITALFVVGPERDDDRQRLTTLVTDDAAFQRWNRGGRHVLGYHEVDSDDAEMTLSQLIGYGRKELNKRIAAAISYEITAAYLGHLFPYEDVNLGDRFKVKNTDIQPPLYAEARAIAVKESLTDPSLNTYTIGEIKEHAERDILAEFRKMQEKYGTRVIRQDTPPPGQSNVIWVKTGDPNAFEVAHVWSTSANTWVPITPRSADDLGAITEEDAVVISLIERMKAVREARKGDKAAFAAEADSLRNNPYLTSHSMLDQAQASFDGAYAQLLEAIDNAIADGTVSTTERIAYEDALATYDMAATALRRELVAAQSTITEERSKVVEGEVENVEERMNTQLTDQIALIDEDITAEANRARDEALAGVDSKIADATAGLEAELEGKADKSGVYTKTEVDSALNSKVSTATYTVDQNGVITRLDEAESRISQTEEAISSAVSRTEYDALEGRLVEAETTISQTASAVNAKADATVVDGLTTRITSAESNIDGLNAAISQKVDATVTDGLNTRITSAESSIDALEGEIVNMVTSTELVPLQEGLADLEANVRTAEERLTAAEERITDSGIIQTVTASTEFQVALNEKANAEDLAGYATTEALQNISDDLALLSEEYGGIEFGEFVKASELEQTEANITARFSVSGGVNLIRNSVGYSGIDFWTKIGSGKIEPTSTDELERLGFGSGFLLRGSQISEMLQMVAVVPEKPYSFSYYVKKTDPDARFSISVTEITGDGSYGEKLYTKQIEAGEVTDGFERFSGTFTSRQPQLQIVVHGDDGDVTVSALMLNIGEVPFSWTTAAGEVYNTNVKMDLNGIRVSQIENGVETNYTVMTPEKFAGYFDTDGDGSIDTAKGSEDEVFRMDKDEFVMKKANAKDEITMGSIKIIRVNSGGRRGWAFLGV